MKKANRQFLSFSLITLLFSMLMLLVWWWYAKKLEELSMEQRKRINAGNVEVVRNVPNG